MPFCAPATRRSAMKVGCAGILVGGYASAGLCARSLSVNASSFRKPGMSDLDVLRATLMAWQEQGSGTCYLEQGRLYDLGQVATGPDLMAFGHLDQATLDGNGAKIVARSAPGLVWNLFSIANVSNLLITNLSATDLGYRDRAAGMKMIVLQPGVRGTSGVRLENVTAERVLSFVQAQGPAAPNRVGAVTFGDGCVARRCYYALCCVEQGDDITGLVRAIDCRRAYLVYGVNRHRLKLDIIHHGAPDVPASRSPVLIKSYGRPTSDLVLTARFGGSLPWNGQGPGDPGSCVMLEQQPAPGQRGIIEGIDLTIEIDPGIPDRNHARLLTLSSVSASGSEEHQTNNVWRDIALHVRTDTTREIAVPVSPAEPLAIRLSGDVSRVVATPLAPNVRIVS